MIKSDRWIRQMSLEHGMIDPFRDDPERTPNIISSGLTNSGYDVRLSNKYLKFVNNHPEIVIDPKNLDPKLFIEHEGDFVVIPPNSFALGHSMEKFKKPKGIKGFCEGKSTYARCAVSIPMTPLEPGWEGVLTIEIGNHAPNPLKVYSFEGIAQISFFEVEECDSDYSSRSNKYQGQTGITLPRSSLKSARLARIALETR